ncbi:MAG: PP2C family protein-serine/threonine phosphatase [Candidatus Acidiferrales bacterium]
MSPTAKPPVEAAMEIEAGARSDTGRVRENNEDSCLLASALSLFVLSDGMGGLASGEVASRLTVETIVAHCRDAETNPSLPLIGERIPGVSDAANHLASAVRSANRVVHQAAQKHARAQDSIRAGMGATVVAARIHEGRLSLAHVGDSRAYRLRGDAFEQLTQDHSFVAEQVRRGTLTAQEAGCSNLQNVLLRALGVEPHVDVDVVEELVLEGDTLLLCSDGLTRELSDPQIAAVLHEASDAEGAAKFLVDLANQAGGGDNITAIVLRCAPRRAGAFARVGRIAKLFKGSR